ncbi:MULTISPECIES: DUF3558 domain-containing protein [Prauserella salsuginis group]|uniref:DUF3558 domain-containing protein n=1 Tax=Prauserella salsuginis TaxID=387889 RepID=A0ABW6G234_9PSEU|nr:MULTISPECIES: DUF3558 domain-containing protein [Prauserella salsuginis group]MCR3719974.1 Protein of unknown function (DUF3558) [Prauserella flava]MCR3736482.1 Protein of unknown function (DUF3558) [Prauserella salsuginis]
MRYLVRSAALAAVAMVATACSGGESNGQAQPEPSSPSSTASAAPSSAADGGQELPHSGAPAVTNPLPKSVLDGDPCTDALTKAQAKNFFGDAVTSKDDDSQDLGPGCSWSNDDAMAGFTLNYDVNVGQGLSAVYANSKPKVDNFAEIGPIGGFPAAQYWDDGQKRNCNTFVGLADEYGLVMSLTIGTDSAEQGDDPCEAARTVMDRVVGNLKAKA